MAHLVRAAGRQRGKMGDMAIFDIPLAKLQTRGTIKWRRFEPDVLPMFVAEMDAALAPAIAERLQRAIVEGDTGYPELPAYQEAFADYAAWQWGWEFSPAEATLVTDVVSGMREAVVAVTEPGDKVVINSPIYPPFRGVNHDRTIVDVPLVGDRLDIDGLAAAFEAHRPKAFLLCSPHNPSGTIHTPEELTQVARLAAKYEVVVISDEIHAPLAGRNHTPYLAVPGVRDAVIVTSASKSWNLAALKSGLVIGSESVRSRLKPMVSDGASYFGVLAHVAALTDARDWLAEVAAEIDANKVFFRDQIAAKVPQLSCEPTAGTYLAWLDCTPLGLADPVSHFHQVGRVRFNAGADFSPASQQFVRVNLATSQELIAEGVSRIAGSLS